MIWSPIHEISYSTIVSSVEIIISNLLGCERFKSDHHPFSVEVDSKCGFSDTHVHKLGGSQVGYHANISSLLTLILTNYGKRWASLQNY